MKIHEFQAKAILAGYAVPVPRGEVVTTPAAARAAVERLGGGGVLKAQIHAGGRGKGGGIKLVASPAEAEETAAKLLGGRLRTPQTGPEGTLVQRLLVEEAMAIERELYLGVVIDRRAAAPALMASAAGGMEIEEVARHHPEQIVRVHVDPATGLRPFHGRRLAYGLGLSGDLVSAFGACLAGLYRAFEEKEGSLAEINPLVVTADGRLLALDAKLNLDDSALFRHPELRDLRDLNEESPLEVEASRYGLNYIKLGGTVGCMVNGAGLAMATMDIIKLAGGEPANFLDVGGGASAEQIQHALRILLADPDVRAVLINIFGGILRCDRLAEGVIAAVRALRVTVPVVIRMEGTNVEIGNRMLGESGLPFVTARGMAEAAEKAVAAARGGAEAGGR